MKNTLAVLALCAAPLLAQAQAQKCTGDNADGNYILGEAEGTASAMHWPTGLVWKRCIEGETFSNGACTTDGASKKTWHGWATDYLPKYFADSGTWQHSAPNTQNLLASGAWRMAYKNELISIMQSCDNDPTINRTVFPGTPSSVVWSGSPCAGDSGNAWLVYFYDGNAYDGNRGSYGHVRLVRAGQSFASLDASPITQNAAAGDTAVGFTTTITLDSATGTGTAWGGVRFQNGSSGNPQLQVNGGAWVTQAIVKTGDIIAVRMNAPATGGSSHTATLEVRSGQTTGTNADGSNGGSESTAVQTTTATFTLNTPENGACGSAHDVATLEAPSNGSLCSAGTDGAVTGDANGWRWTCDGIHSGTQASCQAPRGYTFTPLARGNGSVSPSVPWVVAVNTRASFTVTPQAGYRTAWYVSTCGGSLADGVYTTTPIRGDCKVEVGFTLLDYTIGTSVNPAGSGTVDCTPNPVEHGSTATCTATAQTGYTFASFGGACAGKAMGTSCSLANVTSAQNVSASFSLDTYAITTRTDPADAGRVVCAPNPVPHGGSATCKALSNTYRLAEWAGDCAGQSGPVCTLTGVTAPSAATARFDTNAPIPGPLNDTGALACDASGPATQDCHHGRDAGAATGQLTKAGASSDARNGFDFTKIAGDGAELQADAADWACTRDNTTGLVWEVKTAANQDATYTWHDPHSPDGAPGTPGTDTASFVATVNATGLCGATDWRVPTVQELAGLLDLGRAAPAALIDPGYFPRSAAAGYWTRTPFAGDTGQAWQVDFASGAARPAPRSDALRVRLVRGGQ